MILSIRDPDRWYDSMRETILEFMELGLAGAIPEEHPMRNLLLFIARETFELDFSRDNVITAFNRHNSAVRASVVPGRLLEFEVALGWEPLCAFLGVPVPDEPFPRTNARDEFWTRADKARSMNDPTAPSSR